MTAEEWHVTTVHACHDIKLSWLISILHLSTHYWHSLKCWLKYLTTCCGQLLSHQCCQLLSHQRHQAVQEQQLCDLLLSIRSDGPAYVNHTIPWPVQECFGLKHKYYSTAHWQIYFLANDVWLHLWLLLYQTFIIFNKAKKYWRARIRVELDWPLQ